MILSSIRVQRLTPLTFALASLAAMPGQATIVQGGASEAQDAQVLAAAHQLARQHPSAVCVMVKRDLFAPSYAWHSGVWVGSDPKGQLGYILTAAHSYFSKPTDAEPMQPVHSMACFGVAPREAVLVPISRVIIHPERKPCVSLEGGRILPGVNDLALLEFPLDASREQLERRGIGPARIPEEPEASMLENAELRIVGAGPYSTSTSLKVNREPYRLHAGHMRVTQGTFQGQTGLFSWSFVSTAEHPNRPDPEAPGGDLISVPFVHTREAVTMQDAEGSRFLVQSPSVHQILPNPGDSGSPGFQEDKAGDWRLKGIYCRSNLLDVVLPEHPEAPFWCHWSFFEPLGAGTLAWIKAVQEGNPGSSAIVVYDTGPSSAMWEPFLAHSVLKIPFKKPMPILDQRVVPEWGKLFRSTGS